MKLHATDLRIVHIVTRNGPGGSARNLYAQLEWEHRRGCQVELIIGGREAIADTPPGVAVHRFPILVRNPNPVRDLRATLQLRSFIKSRRPDVVHTHQSKAGILGRLAAYRLDAVLVHTIHMTSFGPGYLPAQSWLFASAERRCAKFTDFLVAVGEELKRHYVRAGIGREDQYSVVRSPTDVETYLQTRNWRDEYRTALRRRLGLPAKDPILITAGILEKRKRIDMTISRLRSFLVDQGATLIVAGVGPDGPRLHQLSQRLGLSQRVLFIGHVSNLHEYFAVSNVLVHTSVIEGLPQVLVQGLAAGLPVVATPALGLSELNPAPLTCVRRDGNGLRDACISWLAIPRPEPIPAARLNPWTTAAVLQQRAAFHDRLTDAVRARKSA